MENTPRAFTLGEKELERLLAKNGWTGNLQRVTFSLDPGWVGYVRKDGTGLALKNPSHLEMLVLHTSMAEAAEAPKPDEECLWGV